LGAVVGADVGAVAGAGAQAAMSMANPANSGGPSLNAFTIRIPNMSLIPPLGEPIERGCANDDAALQH
jgi:hypothetical protein